MCCATLLRMPVKSARHQKCVVRRRCKAVLRLPNESHVLTTPRTHSWWGGALRFEAVLRLTLRFSAGARFFSWIAPKKRRDVGRLSVFFPFCLQFEEWSII